MTIRHCLVCAALAILLAACVAAQKLPRPLGEFSISSVDGPPIKLSSSHGKPLLVFFLLTTCPHCQETTRMLNRLKPVYATRGLQIVGSAIDDASPQNAVKLFLKNFQPAFPLGYSDPMATLSFCDYSTSRLPHLPILLFVDRTGNILEQHEGADADYFGTNQEQRLRASIEALLASGLKPAAAKGKAAPTKSVAPAAK